MARQTITPIATDEKSSPETAMKENTNTDNAADQTGANGATALTTGGGDPPVVDNDAKKKLDALKKADELAAEESRLSEEAAAQAARDVEAQETARRKQTIERQANVGKYKAGQKLCVYNPTPNNMRDPFTGDGFPSGKTVRVKELGSWTISQLVERHLREGKEDDVGEAIEDNSDFIADTKKTGKKTPAAE